LFRDEKLKGGAREKSFKEGKKKRLARSYRKRGDGSARGGIGNTSVREEM